MKNEEQSRLKSWMKPVSSRKSTHLSFVSTMLLRRSLTERLFRLHSHPDAKREKIKDLLTFIQERLDELEEEKEELKQYQVSILDLAFLGERYSLVIFCHASICHRLMIEREDLSSIVFTNANSKIVQKHSNPFVLFSPSSLLSLTLFLYRSRRNVEGILINPTLDEKSSIRERKK